MQKSKARLYFVINDSTKRAFSLGPLVLSKQTFIYMSQLQTSDIAS